LPSLIEFSDLQGDLHVHTNWTDGDDSVERMIGEAEKRGLNYVCITDHAGSLAVAKAFDNKMLLKKKDYVEGLKDKYKIKVLFGCELDIEKDGSFKVSDNVLDKLDFVVASIHSSFRQSFDVMTNRILSAFSNPYINCFGHPTSRLINKREGILFDFDKVLDFFVDNKKIFEVNGQPSRSDLNDEHIRLVVDKGGLLAVNSDSHSVQQFDFLLNGVWQARRGWASKKSVVNSWSLNKLLKVI